MTKVHLLGVYTLVASCSSASPSISSASFSATSSSSTSSTASFSHPRYYCAFSQCHRYCVSNKATQSFFLSFLLGMLASLVFFVISWSWAEFQYHCIKVYKFFRIMKLYSHFWHQLVNHSFHVLKATFNVGIRCTHHPKVFHVYYLTSLVHLIK